MKKVLVGMLALVMCLGMVSCSKESATPNLKDVVEKARAEGANWSVDEWKAAMKDCMLAVKPMMLEMQEIMKGLEGTEGEEADGAKVVEVMAKMAEIQKKYPDYENLMNEFEEIAKGTDNGKKVIEDDAYAKELAKELGLPEDL
ncbi:MAG: hypothetical protein K6D61_05590 [Prevotella sp.]|nr:hypothetical protein [Prevotella sp.]